MAVIALANLKGGVGKSTLAVNLAGALAPQSVLLDADPQGTALAWAEAGELPFPVIAAPLEGVSLEAWIASALAQEAPFVVVDLPPMLGAATAAALAVSDVVCVPVTPSGADLQATARAMDLVQDARDARGDGLPRVVMIPSKVDRRTAAGGEIEAALIDFGELVGPVIAQRVAHADAFAAGQWIGGYAPGSAAHADVKALAGVVKKLTKGKGRP